MEGAATMKQRNLKPVLWSQLADFLIETDEHGSDIVWQLPDGRVYRCSGILETPVREDLRRPLEAGS